MTSNFQTSNDESFFSSPENIGILGEDKVTGLGELTGGGNMGERFKRRKRDFVVDVKVRGIPLESLSV